MTLISSSDQERLRQDFGRMTHDVRLVFFTQSFACDTCLQAQQILSQLPPLSNRIAIEEVNFVLEPERARQYGIDRVPAIAVCRGAGQSEPGGAASFEDTRMRFLGTPSGYEFISLVQAVLLAGGGESRLSADSRALLAKVQRPMTCMVFTTPSCPHCPRAVTMAQEMAFANPNITAFAVEVTEYPDLARRYHVSGVPKTVVDEEVEILGALPEDAFVAQALARITGAADGTGAGAPGAVDSTPGGTAS
jgi:glutaredoxin-like protein